VAAHVLDGAIGREELVQLGLGGALVAHDEDARELGQVVSGVLGSLLLRLRCLARRHDGLGHRSEQRVVGYDRSGGVVVSHRGDG